MILLGIISIGTFIMISGLLMLVQALVSTELEIARQLLTRKKAAMSQQEEEIDNIKKRHQLLLGRITELESSRQDLFNYVVKQENMLEKLRQPRIASSDDNGTPLV
jgi:Tfp pilus assembly protein PilN